MKQEEKDLLLKDLCARLPYGVKIQVYYEEIAGSGYFDEDVWVVDNDEPFHVNDRWLENIKPYLRPMSSMTEEEFHDIIIIDNQRGIFSSRHLTLHLDGEVIDYLNSKMFDWRNLITMGLALEAPEGMYNIKNK